MTTKAIPWRGGEGLGWDVQRACPFVIEIKHSYNKRYDLDCQGHRVNGRGGPSICICSMTDLERGELCGHWYHLCEIPLELATNCCWNFQMLVTGCVAFRTSYGKKQPYFSIRKHDWDKDVHRCYQEPVLQFCPYCGAEVEWKEKD